VRCVGQRRRRGDVVTSPVAVRGPRSVGGADFLGVAVAAPFAVVALLVAASGLRLPAHVDQVMIDNPHEWPAHIQVTDDRDGWVGVGTVGRETEQGFLEVVDQGDVWIFLFSYASEAVELRVSGAQLEDDDWRVTVPDGFAEALRARGVATAPR
jgi:hypothetical protein